MYVEHYISKLRKNDNLDWFLIGYILSIAWSLYSVVPSVYFTSLGISEQTIGAIFSVKSLVQLVFSFFLISLLQKFNHARIFLLTTIPIAMIFFLFPSIQNFFIVIVLFYLNQIFLHIRGQAREIEFRNSTTQKEFTHLKSLSSAVGNLFWIILPLLGGMILEFYGFNIIFYMVSVLVLLSGLMIKFLNVKTHQISLKKINYNFINNIKYYFHKKQLVLSFMTYFSLGFWYCLIFIYLPLLVLNLEYSKIFIGVAIAVTQVPLPFIQYKTHYFIKRIGIKKLFMYTYLVLMIISLLIFSNQNIYIIISLLFISGIMVSFLEVLPHIYYFKQVNKSNEDRTFPIFSDGNLLAKILGNSLFGIILIFFPIQYLFLCTTIVMCGFFIMSFYLKDYKN